MSDWGAFSPVLVGGRPLMADGSFGEPEQQDWGGIEAPAHNEWQGIETPQAEPPSYDQQFLDSMQRAGRVQNPASIDYAPTAFANVLRSKMNLPREVTSREQSRMDENLKYRLWHEGYTNDDIGDMTAAEYEAKRNEFSNDPAEQHVFKAVSNLRQALKKNYIPPENQDDWPQEMLAGADNLGEPLNITAMKAVVKAAHAPKDEAKLDELGKKPEPDVSTTAAFKELEPLRKAAYERAQRGTLTDPEFLPKLKSIARLNAELEAKYPDFASEPGFKAFSKETSKWLNRSAHVNEQQFKRDVEATRANWNAGVGGDFSGSEAGGIAVGIGTGSRSLAATAARGVGSAINSMGAPGVEVIGNALTRIADKLQYGNRVLDAAQQQAVSEQNYGTIRKFLGENIPGAASSLYQAAATAPAGMGGMTAAFGAVAANDAYFEAKQQGLSDSDAVKHATVEGGLEMLFMTLFNKLGKKFPGLEGMQSYFAPAAEKLAKDGAMKQAKRFLIRMAGEQIEENLTSISQTINQAMNLPQSKGQDQWFDPKKEGFDSFYDSPMMQVVRKTTAQTALMMAAGEAGHQAVRAFAKDPSRANYNKLPREIRELHHLPPEMIRAEREDLAKKLESDPYSLVPPEATTHFAPGIESTTGEGVISNDAPEEEQRGQVGGQVLNPDAAPTNDAATEPSEDDMARFLLEEDAKQGMTPSAAGEQDAGGTSAAISSSPTTSGQSPDAVAEQAAASDVSRPLARTVADLPELPDDYVRVLHKGPAEAEDSIRATGLNYSGILGTTARSWGKEHLGEGAKEYQTSTDSRFSPLPTYVFDVPADEHHRHERISTATGVLPAKYLVGVLPPAAATGGTVAASSPAASQSEVTTPASDTAPRFDQFHGTIASHGAKNARPVIEKFLADNNLPPLTEVEKTYLSDYARRQPSGHFINPKADAAAKRVALGETSPPKLASKPETPPPSVAAQPSPAVEPSANTSLQAGAIPSDVAGVQAEPPASASKPTEEGVPRIPAINAYIANHGVGKAPQAFNEFAAANGEPPLTQLEQDYISEYDKLSWEHRKRNPNDKVIKKAWSDRALRQARKKSKGDTSAAPTRKSTAAPSQTLFARIKSRYGAISEKSMEKYGVEIARQNGLRFIISKNATLGIDQIAQEMESLGEIRVPDGWHADDWLVEQLYRGMDVANASYSDKVFEKQLADDEQRAHDNAKRYAEDAELEEVRRRSDEAGVRAADEAADSGDFGDAFEPSAEEAQAVIDAIDFGDPFSLQREPTKSDKPPPTVQKRLLTESPADDLVPKQEKPLPGQKSLLESETVEAPAESPIIIESAPKASVTVGNWDTIKAGDHDLRLAISKAANHYTLWYQIPPQPGRPVAPWRYVRILGGNKAEAHERAKQAADRIAAGDLTGLAFIGKEQIALPKSIGLVEHELGPAQLMAAERGPIGEQPVGFGKYHDVLLKDLFAKDPGYAIWLADSASSGRGKQAAEYLSNHPDLIASRDADIAATHDAMTPESIAVLQGHGITPEALARGGIALRGKTYDWKDFIKSIGGRFNDGSWIVSPDGYNTVVAKLGGIAKPAGGQRGGVPAYESNPGLGELRRDADARPDTSGFSGPVAEYIGGETSRLIERGRAIGMPEVVVNEQIEDVARINRAYQQGKKLFLLASEPGSGKTFVLGGAIRELQAAGAKRIVYVTLRSELITQIKNDLKDYGIEGVEFVTYPSLREAEAKATDVLIFDEAHSIKNVGKGDESAQQAAKAAEWIKRSRFTVLSTATPFENPVQAQYLEAAGVFDRDFDGFRNFALAYGASTYTLKNGDDVMVWKRTASSDADAAAAREYFRKEGIFTSRRIRLPENQVDSRLVKVNVDKAAAETYAAFSAAAAENQDSLAGFGAAWIVNFQKRLLEAAKVQHGIREAESALKRGRFPILFVETKAERNIDIPELIEANLRWQQAVSEAQKLGDKPPARSEFGVPPPGVVETLASFMDSTGTSRIEIPSAEDIIKQHFGEAKVAIFTGSVTPAKAQKNLDAWRRGEKPVLVATMAKGGTGLSLHDKVGDHQTTQININLPWTATQVVQVAQRSARYGLVGQAEMQWIFADNIPFDRNLSNKVGGRMADMGAVVHGERLKDADKIEDWNFENKPFSENVAVEPRIEEKTPSKELVLWGRKQGSSDQWVKLTDNTSNAEMARRQKDGWEVLRYEKGSSPNELPAQASEAVSNQNAAGSDEGSRASGEVGTSAARPAEAQGRQESPADPRQARVAALPPDTRAMGQQLVDAIQDVQATLAARTDAAELKALRRELAKLNKGLDKFLTVAESVEPIAEAPSTAERRDAKIANADRPKTPKEVSEAAQQRVTDALADADVMAHLRAVSKSVAKAPLSADDVLQEAMLHMIERAESLRPEDPFDHWATRVVQNTARDLGRKESRERGKAEAAAAEEQYAADKAAVGEELKKAIRKAAKGESTNSLLGPVVPLTPELAAAIAKMLKSGLKAKALTFGVFVRDVRDAVGGTLPANLKNVLVNAWNKFAVGLPSVSAADFEAALDGETFGDTPTPIDEPPATPKKPAVPGILDGGDGSSDSTPNGSTPSNGATIGTKNAKMYEFAERHGLDIPQKPPKETFEGWLEAAERRYDTDPNWIPNLIFELEQSRRAITPTEDHGFKLYVANIDKQLSVQSARLIASAEAKDDAANAAANAAAEALKAEGNRVTRILDVVGTIAGRQLATRRSEIEEGMGEGDILRRWSIARNGNALPPARATQEARQAKTLADTNAAAEKVISESEAKHAAEVATTAAVVEHNKVVEDVAKERRRAPGKRTSKATAKMKAAVADFFDFVKQVSKPERANAVAYVQIGAKAANVVKAYAELNFARFADFMEQLIADAGDSVKAYESEFRAAFNAQRSQDIVDSVDLKNQRTIGAAVREAHRFVVDRDGLTKSGADRDRAIAGIHEILKDAVPGLTLAQTARIMSGKDEGTRKLTKYEVEAEHRAQQQIIEDTLAYEADKPSNRMVETLPDTPEKRDLRRKRAEAKKNANIPEVIDPSKQLTTALESAKTRMLARIFDLKKAVRENKRIQHTQSVLKDEKGELIPIEAELVKAQAEYDAHFGKPEMSEEQRRASLEKSLDREIAALEQDPLGYSKPRKDAPTSPAIEAKRARLAEKRAERDELRLLSPEALARAETKQENALVKQIEKLKARLAEGQFMPAEPKSHTVTENKEALREELKTLQEELDYTRKNSPAWQERSDAAYLRSITKQTAYWADIEASGDFAPRPPRAERKLTDAHKKAIADRERAKASVKRQEDAYRRANLHWFAKSGRFVKDTLFGVYKTLKLSGDLAMGRQGWLLGITHPMLAAKALPAHFAVSPLKDKSIFPTEADAAAARYELESGPNADLYQRMGLEFLQTHGDLSHRAEAIGNAWATNNAWIGGAERANATGLNAQKAIVAHALVDNLLSGGWWVGGNQQGATDSELRVIGNLLNVAQGRGNFGKESWNQAVSAFSQGFLSPRWWLSRVQIMALQPLWHDSRWLGGEGSTPRVRRLMAKEVGKQAVALYLTAGLITTGLMAAFGGGGPDKWWEYDGDRKSSTFGHVRLGKRWFDLTASVGQHIVFLSRVFGGERTDYRGIRVPTVGKGRPFGKPGTWTLIGQYIASKLDIVPKMTVDYLAGETPGGKQITPKDQLDEAVQPLFIKDVRETLADEGVPAGIIEAVIEFAGVNSKRDFRTTENFQHKVILDAVESLSAEDKPDWTVVDGKRVKAPKDDRGDSVVLSARQRLLTLVPDAAKREALLEEAWTAKHSSIFKHKGAGFARDEYGRKQRTDSYKDALRRLRDIK